MQDAGDVSFSKEHVDNKTNTSLQKNGGKNPRIRRWKPKPRSHVKRIGSVLSKRKASELSSNGARSKRLNGKRFRRKTAQKVIDTSSSEKPLSSMLHEYKSKRKCLGNERTTDSDVANRKRHRRRKPKKREKVELDETARLQRRTRYLLIRMKQEQNLIEAYSGEGWKGQSREKIRPEKELQRAKKQILQCKLGIRDAIRQLETLSSEGCIEDSVIAPDGSVFHEHIFCSKCKLREAFPDNDIILCDGTCNCAFHQKCLEPPLATENIPPGDQGWYCKFCESKMEILEAIDAQLGTQFPPDSKWQDIFIEAAAACDREDAYPGGDWPSDDSGDVDYDPESYVKSCSSGGLGSEEHMTDDASSSGSLNWTSEEEEGLHSQRLVCDGSLEERICWDPSEKLDSDRIDGVGTAFNIDANGGTDLIAFHRRPRGDVDYKKLHDEMFKSEEISEDEDWGPCERKRRRIESDPAGTVVSMCDVLNGVSEVSPMKRKKKYSSVQEERRKLFRIPPDAVKKLREVFSKNELPSRVVRENLSKQFGIALQKINKWFKNARYTALKIRKAERVVHPIRGNATKKKSSIESDKTPSAEALAAKVEPRLILSETGTRSLRKVRQRMNTKLIVTPSRKLQEKKPTDNVNEVNPWLSKSVYSKKHMGSSKRKSVEKRVNPTHSNSKEQLYMAEVERIFRLEERLEKMKGVLLSLGNNKNQLTKGSSMDERVIYVPVAELREKV